MAASDRDEKARLEALAAALIHRFNNVLMGIQPHVEVIKRASKDNDRVLGSVAQIEGALRRAKTMMSEVRSLAHPLEIAVEPLPVGGWFDTMRDEIHPFRSENPIDLTFASESGLVASGNREQLTRAIANLVTNAAEAMPEGGAIEVRARAVPEGVEIVVRDNGTGLEPDAIARAFEPLYTTKRNQSGVGLAIVRQIVDAHGGTVTLDSKSGGPTTVTIVVRRG